GIFDVSHLGKALVTGPGAVDFLNRCLTNDLRKVGPGQAQYSMLCNDDGGVIDDLICYVKSDDEVFLIPNAANCATVVATLASAAPDGITVTDLHHDYAVLAVQGTHSDEVLASMGLPTDIDYMGFDVVDHEGDSYTVCRTGYTGEKGFELVVPSSHACAIWDALMVAGEPFGIRPCGLGARDTLRTEMGYSLHGSDISPWINPVEAGLSWAIGWSKDTFFGEGALRQIKAEGPGRRMRGLKALGRGIPRHDMRVVDSEGEDMGVVTSGTFSPTLKQGIALALVDVRFGVGDTVGVAIRNRVELFEVVKPPFVKTQVREG
ncbi:MAG TPA: glycine cleavage system aminomethyltransferase GcvT, partial [Propionibacteriaceae bacterium]|nr:glycine cleavage system aminomethyltransferase GcvT [Propionibacteriaceae bacterium]